MLPVSPLQTLYYPYTFSDDNFKHHEHSSQLAVTYWLTMFAWRTQQICYCPLAEELLGCWTSLRYYTATPKEVYSILTKAA